ncbi:trypsin-like serine peptidase [Streptomyces sp. NPDC006692]|uniref:trypsin-like serine peptidase n=1 Tax=Streptomyces sp. NPDC006692 TaxID=3364758 RepID=UPI00369E42A7
MRRNAHWGRWAKAVFGTAIGAVLLATAVGVLTVVRTSEGDEAVAARAAALAASARAAAPPAGPPGTGAARYPSAPAVTGLDGGPGLPAHAADGARPEQSLSCVADQRRPEPHDLASECGYRAVGVFLRPGGTKSCTAGVVDSRHGDLLVTAAHCLPLDGASFVPGYHDGAAPYGSWPVLAALPDPRFAEAQKGAENWPYDWAFVRVARVGGKSVQEAVGSVFHVPAHPERLPADLGPVTLIGYPHDRPGQHICTVDSQSAYTDFRQAQCAGFSTGVSGSPWVISAQEGEGIVVGVLGGAERGGGLMDDVSYTARFDEGITSLFATAQGTGPGDSLLAR